MNKAIVNREMKVLKGRPFNIQINSQKMYKLFAYFAYVTK